MKLHPIFFILYSILISGQSSFHNTGNIQIHNGGQIGFHIDVINNGVFDQNVGFAGFYSADNSLEISGNNRPVFHDMEIDVADDLYLEVAVGVSNFQQFTNGLVHTPRDRKEVALDYLNDAPFLGENDNRHVDGYASITGNLDFSFPIGDDYRHRPMRIEEQAAINTAKGAYYFENPNNPNFFPRNFDTNNFESDLFGISIFEFWDLDGNTSTTVTLTWDDSSNIPALVDDLSDLRVVGWDKNTSRWVNLGNTTITGDFNNGEITSESIIPDNYEILTFGSSSRLLDGDLEIYTAVSPNGDEFNETFIIEGLSKFPDNELFIYNRWGVLVYQQERYHEVQKTDPDKAFRGVSSGRVTIAPNEELPAGTYYYVLNLGGEKDRAGYLYLNR